MFLSSLIVHLSLLDSYVENIFHFVVFLILVHINVIYNDDDDDDDGGGNDNDGDNDITLIMIMLLLYFLTDFFLADRIF